MNKQLFILMMILVLSSAFVFAGFTTVTDLGSSGDYKVAYNQGVINKGWNLLPTEVGAWGFSSETSESTFQSLKAFFIYLPLNQKYISILGGFMGNDQALLEKNKPYLESGAGWYYFDKQVQLSYTVENGGGMPKLYRGWNLLSISPSMSNDMEDFPKGNCEVTSFFMWDSQGQKWISWKDLGSNVDKALGELSDPDGIGAGVAIKVKDTCQLGTASGDIGTPPVIPN